MGLEVEAKVAEVLPPYEVVLNVGQKAGVKAGHIVTIWRTVEIKDPVSKARIGSVRRPKLRMEITEVQENLSIAQSIEFIADPLDTFFGSMQRPKGRKRVVPGAARDTEEEASIAVGDSATVQSPTEKPKPKVT